MALSRDRGGRCYCGGMAQKKSDVTFDVSELPACACRVNHHGGFHHGPPNAGGGFCFDCLVIKKCHEATYTGPQCPTHDIHSGDRCGQRQGHWGPHSYQGSLLS